MANDPGSRADPAGGDARRCPRCGSAMPGGAGDPCPRCLLLLALPPSEPETPADGARPSGTPTPERVGPYRLLERIGEGGMGVVFLAEQETPIRRRVAVKLIKLGLDTAQVTARFESERQALALMSHPNVAKVLDAGATADGRPYFVMEYVPGAPITEYCDQHRLRVDERLDLFLQACDALQHAHQKGIIHRDVKPSNVLVTLEDDRPVVKVIDFGIAKAISQRLTEQTLFTHHGMVVGTPEYMSPEQAEGRAGDVDTRTDVYSLGILLYVLVAGAHPFEREALLAAGYDELRRLIREVDPPRPSSRVSGPGEVPATAAHRRRTDRRTLTRTLRGDLDWIVMRALEKEPSRRYGSPSELAAEIRRHRANQPVLAGPPSKIYTLRKLARRHRMVVTAGALVALALVAGATVATLQAIRAGRAEAAAREEAETARQTADFLVGLFEVSDPGIARGNSVTAREILDRGRRRLELDLADRPLVRARMLATIGDIYRKLGLYADAAPLLEDALAARETVLGRDHPEVGRSVLALARLRADGGDDAAAAPLFERARRIFEAARGPDHPDTAEVVSDLAELARRQGHYDEAEAAQRAALEIRRASLGEEHPQTAASWSGLGAILYRRGEYAPAADAFERALAIRETALGADHPDVALTLEQLAPTVSRLGREAESVALLERSFAITEKVYGPDHRRTAEGIFNLGTVYGRQGRLAEAEAAFRRSAEIRRRVFGDGHPELSKSYKNLGQALLLQGRYEEAEAMQRRSLEIDLATLEPDHFWIGASHVSLASVYRRMARWDEAEEHYLAGLAVLEVAVGPANYEYLRALEGTGYVARGRGRLEAAESIFRRALTGYEAAMGADNPSLVSVVDALGETLRLLGRAEEGLALHERGLAIRRTHLRPDHPGLADGLAGRGEALAALGRSDEAERSFREALALWEAELGPDHPNVARGLHGLAGLRALAGDASGAEELYRRALTIRRARFAPEHPAVAETEAALAELTGAKPGPDAVGNRV